MAVEQFGWEQDHLTLQAVVAQLDDENEHHRGVTDRLRALLEDAVTREVLLEHRVDELLVEQASLRAKIAQLTARLSACELERQVIEDDRRTVTAQFVTLREEHEALLRTKLLRYSRVPRSVYARLRQRRA